MQGQIYFNFTKQMKRLLVQVQKFRSCYFTVNEPYILKFPSIWYQSLRFKLKMYLFHWPCTQQKRKVADQLVQALYGRLPTVFHVLIFSWSNSFWRNHSMPTDVFVLALISWTHKLLPCFKRINFFYFSFVTLIWLLWSRFHLILVSFSLFRLFFSTTKSERETCL